MQNKRQRYAKVVVTFERRSDGGLRAFCDNVPGFVLSHKDPELVMKDVAPALERILSAMWGEQVYAERLFDLNEILDERQDDIDRFASEKRDYVAHVA